MREPQDARAGERDEKTWRQRHLDVETGLHVAASIAHELHDASVTETVRRGACEVAHARTGRGGRRAASTPRGSCPNTGRYSGASRMLHCRGCCPISNRSCRLRGLRVSPGDPLVYAWLPRTPPPAVPHP